MGCLNSFLSSCTQTTPVVGIPRKFLVRLYLSCRRAAGESVKGLTEDHQVG